MNGVSVIVPGASSQIGVFAIPELLSCGYRVQAVSRKGKPEWCPEMEGVTWIRPGDRFGENNPPAEFILSAGPLELAIQWLGTTASVQRIIAFSTTSVQTKAESGNQAEKARVSAIASEEKKLAAVCRQNEVDYCLLRPSMVYGCGLDHNVSLIARWITRFGFFPVSRRAVGLRQPVHAWDLAGAAVRALSVPDAANQIMALGGGSTLTYKLMVERIFEALGRSARIIELPTGVLAAMAGVAAATGVLPGINSEMVYRQERDLLVDDEQARQVLDWQPRRFRPALADFDLPEMNGLCRRK